MAAWTTPRTWVVGEQSAAANMNTYVRDNPAFLYGDTAWTALTVSGTGFTNGTPALAIRQMGTLAMLRGKVQWSGTLSGFQQFTTLPAGYRSPALVGVPPIVLWEAPTEAVAYNGSITPRIDLNMVSGAVFLSAMNGAPTTTLTFSLDFTWSLI